MSNVNVLIDPKWPLPRRLAAIAAADITIPAVQAAASAALSEAAAELETVAELFDFEAVDLAHRFINHSDDLPKDSAYPFCHTRGWIGDVHRYTQSKKDESP